MPQAPAMHSAPPAAWALATGQKLAKCTHCWYLNASSVVEMMGTRTGLLSYTGFNPNSITTRLTTTSRLVIPSFPTLAMSDDNHCHRELIGSHHP